MTNKQILEKATDIAFDNGWGESHKMDWGSKEAKNLWLEGILKHYYDVIFSHDFAKSFWGDETTPAFLSPTPSKAMRTLLYPAWQFNLQQMVLEEEPLKYLKKFIK